VVPGASLAAVYGRSLERTRVYAQRFAVPAVYVSFEELLAAAVDAIYVSTLPGTHAQICIEALNAGKHVMCEKPAALNTHQLEDVLEAARNSGSLFMEAMKPPFFPLYRKLREHLERDPIGQVGFVRAGHADSVRAPHYPVNLPEQAGGGLMAMGPYQAFLALDWLGGLRRVQTMGRLSAAGVDSLALIQTEHEHGIAQLHAGLDLLSRGDALLCAPSGCVLIHPNWWNPTRATIYYGDGRTVEFDEPFTHGGFNYETEHFCELIRKGAGESPVISHALSLNMARLLETARHELGVRFPDE
jgi:predicted dehydrogenase